MYQRLMNKLDVDIWSRNIKDSVDSIVIKRVKEQINVLDDAYGSDRGSRDMGGYILFFNDYKSYENCIDEILDFYNLDKELYEYSDCINEECNSETEWMEELYMRGSDEALVLVHPKASIEM